MQEADFRNRIVRGEKTRKESMKYCVSVVYCKLLFVHTYILKKRKKTDVNGLREKTDLWLGLIENGALSSTLPFLISQQHTAQLLSTDIYFCPGCQRNDWLLQLESETRRPRPVRSITQWSLVSERRATAGLFIVAAPAREL